MKYYDDTVVAVDNTNINLIYKFVNFAGSSLKSFRYFDSRLPEEAIKKHIKTLVIIRSGIPHGYAHLDNDGDNIWLGLCVAEKSKGLGLGKRLMEEILKYKPKDRSLTLSVDADNHIAIKLYHKFGFSNKIIIMDSQ